MRTSQANKLARWAAMAAGTVTLVSLLAYGWRQWEAQRALREAPPVVPEPVKKRSETFSYSKVEGSRTLFTIRASQATEYKEGGKSQLEDVWITIYGKSSKRFDNIHTRECDYQPASGRIVCAGEVQIDLESAEEAGTRPGQRAIQIRTSGVNFDRESGEARTTQPVEFKFAYGTGRGAGLRYSTREGIARLEKDVEVMLAASREAPPTRLTGTALEYARDARIMRLLGPVVAVQGARELRAGALQTDFSPEMTPQRLLASGRPTLRELAAEGDTTLSAERITVLLAQGNVPEKVIADGKVAFNAKDAASDDRISAQHMEMDLLDYGRQPGQVRATGAVQVLSQRAGSGPSRRLDTESLQLDFAAAAKGRERYLSRAETRAPATVEFRQGEDQSRVRAARLTAEFDARTEIRAARGTGGVEVQRRIGRGPEQQTSSREFALRFDRRGEWTHAEQTGDVRFRAGARTGEAQSAVAVRAAETLTLSGGAMVADAVSRTSASSIEINQRTGDVLAKGGARTSYAAASQRAGAPFVPSFAPQPAHITAAEMRGNADAGRALYTGRARLWQGEAVIEAESIELRRGAGEEKELHALREVRAVFPQVRRVSNSAANVAPNDGKTFWQISAEQLHYRSSESLIRLEEKVAAESSIGKIQAQRLDLLLAAVGSGPQQLVRAEAHGGVSVRQGDRRGTAERADYFASEGKFVLSGGKPTLYDAALGTTTGRQLTFFLADDKILVESEEGSRTVTRHRVEK